MVRFNFSKYRVYILNEKILIIDENSSIDCYPTLGIFLKNGETRLDLSRELFDELSNKIQALHSTITKATPEELWKYITNDLLLCNALVTYYSLYRHFPELYIFMLERNLNPTVIEHIAEITEDTEVFKKILYVTFGDYHTLSIKKTIANRAPLEVIKEMVTDPSSSLRVTLAKRGFPEITKALYNDKEIDVKVELIKFISPEEAYNIHVEMLNLYYTTECVRFGNKKVIDDLLNNRNVLRINKSDMDYYYYILSKLDTDEYDDLILENAKESSNGIDAVCNVLKRTKNKEHLLKFANKKEVKIQSIIAEKGELKSLLVLVKNPHAKYYIKSLSMTHGHKEVYKALIKSNNTKIRTRIAYDAPVGLLVKLENDNDKNIKRIVRRRYLSEIANKLK